MRAAGAELGRALLNEQLPRAVVKASKGSAEPLVNVFSSVAGGFASVIDASVDVDRLVSQVREGLSVRRRAELDSSREEILRATTRALNMLPSQAKTDGE
jgi:hypothetical protein